MPARPTYRFGSVKTCCAAVALVLIGCTGEPPVTTPAPAPVTVDADLESAKPSPITFEQVAETFALGGKFTDLQRDLLKKELVGSVVEWRLTLFDVEQTGNAYKITSQPYPIRSPDAVNLIRAVAFVRPRSSADNETMRRLVTGSEIVVRGQVREIVLRTVVTLSPATLVNRR